MLDSWCVMLSPWCFVPGTNAVKSVDFILCHMFHASSPSSHGREPGGHWLAAHVRPARPPPRLRHFTLKHGILQNHALLCICVSPDGDAAARCWLLAGWLSSGTGTGSSPTRCSASPFNSNRTFDVLLPWSDAQSTRQTNYSLIHILHP